MDVFKLCEAISDIISLSAAGWATSKLEKGGIITHAATVPIECHRAHQHLAEDMQFLYSYNENKAEHTLHPRRVQSITFSAQLLLLTTSAAQ